MINPTKALGLLAILAMTGVSDAWAQDEDDRKVVYKDRTEIDFEGLDVSGELVKPQGALLLSRKKASFNPLIRLRTDFNEEMASSVDEVR
jgi:hypothetical protein